VAVVLLDKVSQHKPVTASLLLVLRSLVVLPNQVAMQCLECNLLVVGANRCLCPDYKRRLCSKLRAAPRHHADSV
jgi:hypothetical protein